MLSTKQLMEWLSQFPDDVEVKGEYSGTCIDLKVILHSNVDGEPDVISTIGIE